MLWKNCFVFYHRIRFRAFGVFNFPPLRLLWATPKIHSQILIYFNTTFRRCNGRQSTRRRMRKKNQKNHLQLRHAYHYIFWLPFFFVFSFAWISFHISITRMLKFLIPLFQIITANSDEMRESSKPVSSEISAEYGALHEKHLRIQNGPIDALGQYLVVHYSTAKDLILRNGRKCER